MALEVSKEQVVLGGTVLILGLMLWQSGPSDGAGGTRSSRRRSSSSSAAGDAEFISCPAPDTALARPEVRRAAGDRDLFSPPRDTRPLPPLDMVAPPLPAATALRPPPEPPVAPDSFGRFLRADPTPTYVPGLSGGHCASGRRSTARSPQRRIRSAHRHRCCRRSTCRPASAPISP